MATRSVTLAALGVVFGDIGTSPLYAAREAFFGAHGLGVTPENVYGVLSLILWSLIVVISVKYIVFVMRADNRGEGGVLALTALAAPPRLEHKSLWNKGLLLLGLFGSALLFGDGVITPAISVMSAVEGLSVATPLFTPYVIPITIAVLTGLFFSQRYGTAKIGAIFGPVILLWFLTISVLGIKGIVEHPSVIEAIHPIYAFQFFQANGWEGFFVLGAVFLVVTGGEALYADMGHFGRKPIQRAWFFCALPALILNYFGQGALLVERPEAANNPFFNLAPTWALIVVVIIATAATVIASQALISGVFSLTRQAMHLGYAPRFRIVHTSSQEIGQIYIPHINWILYILTCFLVLEFKSSSGLAAAYGLAVAIDMVITTTLACSVAYGLWKWSPVRIIPVFLFFITIDILFLGANFNKILEGGWFPLILGTGVFTLMTTWRKGRQILRQRLLDKSVPFSDFQKMIAAEPPLCTKGIAVFMISEAKGTPPALIHNVRHNHVLHEKNILLTVVSEEVPHVPRDQRVEIEPLADNFHRVVAHYGFMETPNIHEILHRCSQQGLDLPVGEITFFLGRETIIATEKPGMAVWREHIFSFMSRNAERATSYFDIPPNQVVEIGIQVEF